MTDKDVKVAIIGPDHKGIAKALRLAALSIPAMNVAVTDKLIVPYDLANELVALKFKAKHAELSLHAFLNQTQGMHKTRNKSDRKRNRADRWR